MVSKRVTKPGDVSATRDAYFLADMLESVGAPADELDITDRGTGDRVSRVGPSVRIDDDSPVLASIADELVARFSSTRYANPAESLLLVGYDDVQAMREKYDSPAEAGRDLANPDLVMSDTQFTEREYSVTEIGGQCYAVAERYENDDGEAVKTWFVDLGDTHGNRIRALAGEAGDGPTSPHAQAILAAVIDAGPEVRQGPEEQLSVTVESPAAGNASGSGSSDTSESGGDPAFQPDESVGDSDDIDAINEWIENYANVKADLDPEAVEVNAGTYNGMEGYEIDSNPFSAGYYEGDDWVDKDGYDAHQDAFRSIMQDSDPIQYDGDEYLNFLPKADVESVVG